MKSTVIHFEIQADDIERAKKFYHDVFDWDIMQMMKKEEGGMDYWGEETRKSGPGINGGMYQRPEKAEEKNYLYDCTIAVENIDDAMEAVKKHGGNILRGKDEIPGVGWFASAKDTEGNKFGLMQPTGWKPS
jgi:predicted enzyme related to lactoylglutathione lyase